MSDSGDIVIDVDTESGVDVDTESGDCTGGEQDDNENNKEQEENYQADDEEQGDEQGDNNQRDDNQGDAQQCNNETTNIDIAANNNNVKEASSAAPTVNQSNVKNEKKKWDKNKNNKASGKGSGNNNQNGNTNATNKNNNSNNNQSKNPQQNNNNQGKNNVQNKSSHQQNNNNDNNNKNHNNNNTKGDNSISEKNNQDNKNKSQLGDNQANKNNNQGNQNKPNHNNNNQNKPNHNSNNNQTNNNYNKNNNSSSHSNSNANSNNNNNNNSNNNKDNGAPKGGASGVGGLDLLRTIRGLIHYPKKYEKPWPIDSFVLRLHYRLGVAIFILGFLCIKGNWHNYSHTTKCGYNADTNPPAIYENICLSYPFVEEVSGQGPALVTSRRYLLFYRWVYWSFLILAGLFYMPRLFSKQMDNPRLRKLLDELSTQESRYDSNGWDRNCETILSYLHHHQGTHLGLYFNLIICHVFALVVDIGTILFFDFILDGRFLYLFYHVWPLNRDPENFQDPLSSAFPPFAKCELSGSVVLIMAARTEQCYVHLTLMELYEKVFLMLWIWLLVMAILAVFQILALFIMFLPFTHGLLLKTATSNKCIRKMKTKVMKTYGLGDIYALSVIKKRISDAEFRYLLSKLTKIEEEKKEEKVESNDKLKKNDKIDQNVGNYERNISSNTQWLVDEFPPNAPSLYPDVTYPPDLSLGDYFPPDYLRQRRAVSTPKPPSTQQVVPAFPIPDSHMGQPKYGWNSALYRQACFNQTNEMNSPKKGLASHAV